MSIDKYKYPSPEMCEEVKKKAKEAGYLSPVNANLNLLGQELARSSEPTKLERTTWRLLKDVRQRQAQWRSQELKSFQSQLDNPDDLDKQTLRQAAKTFVSLKEKKVSYGDAVFNFAFPSNESQTPEPVTIPKNLPRKIWSMAKDIESNIPRGLPMARIDALRQPDNSIRIIEINPCWVDNIGAVQGLSEVYEQPSQATEMFSRQIIRRQPSNRNITLVYGSQSDGCKRDEIYGFADQLKASGKFDQVTVTRLSRETDFKESGTLYINGTFDMSANFVDESMAIEQIKTRQNQGMVLAPAQFNAMDSKESLVKLSQKKPELFITTTFNRKSIAGKAIAKPLRSESLRGIFKLDTGEEVTDGGVYIYQPYQPIKTNKELVCVNPKTKTVKKPPVLFEKINIWISGSKTLGVVATYDTQPDINDAGYNLPIKWEEK